MSTHSIPVLIMSGVSFYLTLHHLNLFARGRERRLDFSFACMCLTMGIFDLASAGEYTASSAYGAMPWIGLQFTCIALFALSFSWFLRFYGLPMSRRWLTASTAVFGALALLGSFAPETLLFRMDQPLVLDVHLPAGFATTHYRPAPGVLSIARNVFGIAMLIYVLLRARELQRRGDGHRARPVMISLGFFSLAALNDMAVSSGLYAFLYLFEYAFLGIVLVMEMALTKSILDMKTTRRELAASREHMRGIFHATPAGVLLLSPDGQIMDCNETWCRMTGFTRDELEGRPAGTCFFGKELICEALVSPDASRVQSLECECRRSNGSRFWGDMRCAALYDLAGEQAGAIGIVTDITERKEAQEQLRRYREHLQELVDERTMDLKAARDSLLSANRSLAYARDEALRAQKEAERATRHKSEFVANMSHEIRTPLNGVIAMTSLLLTHTLDEDTRRGLEVITTSADSLLILINDILDFSKIEAGKLIIEETVFDLRHLVDNVIEILHSQAEEKGILLEARVDSEVPAWICGDEGRIRQILTNLAGNSVKFTARGSVRIDIAVDESADEETVLRFAVVDTGMGISEEKLEDVFTAFTQADGSISRTHGGTGLGLTISQRLVDLMGGYMEVSSAPGEGSTFSFTLPLKPAQAPLKDRDEPPAGANAQAA